MTMRNYRVTLTTEGPLHIGDGDKIDGKGYFLQGKSICVLNVPAFVSRLGSAQLSAYCEFLAADSSAGLEDFLCKDSSLRALAEKSVSYRSDMQLAKARRGSYQYFDVWTCVKDVQGRPYVPGSSVKGMLRTALLTGIILQNRESYRSLYQDAGDLSAQRIERRAFRNGSTDAVDDLMRFVAVSDSDPLDTSSLLFAKKYDKFAKTDDGRHKHDMGNISKGGSYYYEGNELPIYRECIRPGTTATLSLSIDSRIDDLLSFGPLDAARFVKILEKENDLYDRCFLSKFDAPDALGDGPSSMSSDGRCRYVYQSGPFAGHRCRNNAIDGTGYCHTHQGVAAADDRKAICYLGGGVGFDSKTVINALFENDGERLGKTAHILYEQFPTRIDRSHNQPLFDKVRHAGFMPVQMRAEYKRNGRLKKAKDDHRHWQDEALGVSPHTLKLGIVGDKKYPMGKCSIRIEEAQ